MIKNNWLIEKLQSYYDEEEIERILKGYQSKRVTTFRVNTLKITKEEVQKKFENLNIILKPVLWYPNAFILECDFFDFKNFELYQNGSIYLQSLSSLLPVYFLEPQKEETILDMAAAPGSKTTQIGMETHNKAFITACEKNKVRMERLKFNLQKQGISSYTVIQKDARELDDAFLFDKVLLDAPCTGSGTLNEHSKNDGMLTEESLQKIRNTQIELLRKGLKILKKGGILVYSTCSILKEENEYVLEQIKKEFDITILPIFEKDIPTLKSTMSGVLTVCPNEFYEGFFVAKIRKNS